MPESSDSDPRTEAIEQFEALGLSAYAARTYVALVGQESGTAKSVSERADVPRTRVYDAADELSEWGLVEIEQTTPRRFVPVSADTTSELLREEFIHRIEVLNDVLSALESSDGD